MSRHLPTGSESGRSQELLQKLIARHFGLTIKGEQIKWLSPIVEDDYAEYRDGDFLIRLGLAGSIQEPLHKFWPQKGPQWDGLGRTESGTVILVEAKAYIEEFDSAPCKAGHESSVKIRQSLKATQKYMRLHTNMDWTSTFYQVANRLAHLFYLHVLNKIPTELWLIYFCNHLDPKLSTSRQEWEGAIRLVEKHLGIKYKRLMDCVRHLFFDAQTLCPC